MFQLYNYSGKLSTILLLFWTNLWILFCTKLFVHVVLYQITLNHCNQIAMIIVHHKTNWTVAPSQASIEFGKPTTMLLVLSIKYYPRAAKQRQTTHLLPVIQLRITACRARKSYTGALGRI